MVVIQQIYKRSISSNGGVNTGELGLLERSTIKSNRSYTCAAWSVFRWTLQLVTPSIRAREKQDKIKAGQERSGAREKRNQIGAEHFFFKIVF